MRPRTALEAKNSNVKCTREIADAGVDEIGRGRELTDIVEVRCSIMNILLPISV